MNEKIRELITEINSDEEIVSVSYKTNGFCEAITIDETHLWDSENYLEEYVRQQVSANLLRISELLREKANEILVDEVSRYMDFYRSRLKQNFPNARMSYFRKEPLLWKVTVSGEYEEEEMDEFMDVLVGNFNYRFEYAKLEEEW